MKLTRSVKLRMILSCFYLLIALLPVIAFISSFSNSLRFLIDREMDVQAQLTRSSMNTIYSSILHADSYANALTSISHTQSYIAAPATPSNQLVSRMQSMHDAFPLFYDQPGIFRRVFIYSRSSDSILDRNSGYLNLQQHYDKIFKLQDYTFEEWRSSVLQSKSVFDFISTRDETMTPALLYTRQLLIYPNAIGRIVFYMDADVLLDMLEGDPAPDMGKRIVLYDHSGTVLLHNLPAEPSYNFFERYGIMQGHQEIADGNGEKQILFSSQMPAYGWTLYTSIPRRYFTVYALRMSVHTFGSILPFSLLSCVLLFFILRYSHHPLHAALTDIPDTVNIATLNPFKYVQQSLRHFSDMSQQQELLLRNSRMEMQDAILSMLVYQKKSLDFPLEEKLAEYGLNFDADCYRGLILTAQDPENGDFLPVSNHMHMLILELALKHAPQVRYIKMDGPDQMLFLALLDERSDRTEQLHSSLSRLCWEINEALNGDLRIYVGCETDSLAEVCDSFKTARNMMIGPSMGTAGYLVFSPPQGHAPVYDYTSEDARYLRQKAGMGNAEAVHDRLAELFERNKISRARSAFERQLLYGHMLSTLLEAGYSGTLDTELTGGLSELPLQRFFALLEAHYVTLCKENQYSEQQEERQLTYAVLDEIQSMLGDYGLTQATVAMKFGLTERKFAALVRQQTGMTFSKYLEKLRITKSVELLQNSDLTIEEIALAVGYGSDKSFRRAFKQVMNLPPSDYRP